LGVAEHPAGKVLVLIEIAGHDDELGAKLACPHGWHRRVDPELPCFVGG